MNNKIKSEYDIHKRIYRPSLKETIIELLRDFFSVVKEAGFILICIGLFVFIMYVVFRIEIEKTNINQIIKFIFSVLVDGLLLFFVVIGIGLKIKRSRDIAEKSKKNRSNIRSDFSFGFTNVEKLMELGRPSLNRDINSTTNQIEDNIRSNIEITNRNFKNLLDKLNNNFQSIEERISNLEKNQ